MTDGSGTYYLNITSASAHRFDACAGSPLYPGTLDNLFDLPGMDRRCILGDEYTAEHQALVGVYSDTKSVDESAARAFCSANGGTQ